MPPDPSRGTSVLIIEADDSIRRLIATTLERAGFRTSSAKDGWPSGETEHAVIVRDVNLRPPGRERALEEVAAVAPELLRRTVVTTTAPARAAKAIGAGRVFAVISKPFDLDELVSVVTRCANSSRRTRAKRSRKEVEPAPAPDLGPSGEMESVRRFVTSVPSLRQVLSVPVATQAEATLRAEMCRTIGALSVTLNDAACVETSLTRVAVFRAASKVAERLASTTSWPEMKADAMRRDH
jgi:CheY-like chemotaxis protein